MSRRIDLISISLYKGNDYDAAPSAGIEGIKTYRYSHPVLDGTAALITVRRDGIAKTTRVPQFRQSRQGEPDGWGSDNHRRYLAVEKILGGFDREPIDR